MISLGLFLFSIIPWVLGRKDCNWMVTIDHPKDFETTLDYLIFVSKVSIPNLNLLVCLEVA